MKALDTIHTWTLAPAPNFFAVVAVSKTYFKSDDIYLKGNAVTYGDYMGS